MEFKKLDDLLKLIEKKKDAIAKERDGLRELYYEIGGLIDSFDGGIEALERGKEEIESASI